LAAYALRLLYIADKVIEYCDVGAVKSIARMMIKAI